MSSFRKRTPIHFYDWKIGLKTEMHYKDKIYGRYYFSFNRRENHSTTTGSRNLKASETNLVATSEDGKVSPEELQALIAQSKEAKGDDCLICGS